MNAIACRGEFPKVLNALGLIGIGAEIGVQCGEFSEVILNAWRGMQLLCIDAWRHWPVTQYFDISNVTQIEHEECYLETRRRLSRFGNRATIRRASSIEAARDIPDGALDFVYLDAQHHFEAIVSDIAAWAPKVRPGGVVGGHDYIDGTYWCGEFGVKSAVDAFARSHGLNVVVSNGSDEPASWFVRIPEGAVVAEALA